MEGGSGLELPETDGARGGVGHSPETQAVAVVLVTPQPDWTASSQAEAALKEFKKKHRAEFAEAERLMRKNRWQSAERILQELVREGNTVMDRYEARLSPGSRRELVEKLEEYRLQILSCLWKRGTCLGWGTMLTKLGQHRYLGRKELVRV